jgi:uncharacterized repeat protein (TIGR03803 family)
MTTLVSFCALTNCADGAFPLAGLIADASGNLFGTTEHGGVGGENLPGDPGAGTVFEIAKTTNGYARMPTILVSFCALANCADGAQPFAGLLADANGNLFGTTAGGGANSRGTVFEIAKTTNGYASIPTTLVSFCALAPNCANGAFPLAGLIADASGNLFGTTLRGGDGNNGPIQGFGGGTVFEIAKTTNGYASIPTTLVNFCAVGTANGDCTDGQEPDRAGLLIDANGNLFGTTSLGGANNAGTVFELVKTADGYASVPTILASFCSLANCADGTQPRAGLLADATGNLFGTTTLGGANNVPTRVDGAGTVFEITNSGFVSDPSLTIAAPANGAAVANPVTVHAHVDSKTCNSGFNHLQVLVNGKMAYKGNGRCSIFAPVRLPRSSDALNVQAIAWNGAVMAQSMISVTLSTVTITAPANGDAVTNPVTVNAHVDSKTCNSGFNHLQVLVNGKMAYKGNGHCWISASIALPQGPDALNVQAIAWNGAVMAQSAISVTATPSSRP